MTDDFRRAPYFTGRHRNKSLVLRRLAEQMADDGKQVAIVSRDHCEYFGVESRMKDITPKKKTEAPS